MCMHVWIVYKQQDSCISIKYLWEYPTLLGGHNVTRNQSKPQKNTKVYDIKFGALYMGKKKMSPYLV